MQITFSTRRGVFVIVLLVFTGCTASMRGNWNLSRKDYRGAITHYREDLSRNPDHWQTRQRLGFAYLKTGQLDEAIAEFERVLMQKSGDPYANYYLGLAWLDKGERGKAIEVWRSYRNRKEPLVEREIKRHLTLLEIAESVRLAKQALAEEEKLQTLPPKPGTVAVFYFKDISPDNRLRHLQKALTAMIITDLSQVRSLQVVERVRVQFLLAEMGLGQTGLVDKKTAPRAGRLLGAESLIVGTMEPGTVSVGTSVARTSEQDILGGFSVSEEEEKFFELQKAIVFKILELLRVSLTPGEEGLLGKYHTKNYKAVIYFGQALEALDSGNWKKAKYRFRKALIEDPGFELARVGSETCPAPSAPSIAELGSMSDLEFLATIERSVDMAMAEQAVIEEENTRVGDIVVEPAGAGEPPGVPGSITVRW